MKKLLFIIIRSIVGSESGFTGEGNEQWYYSLSLAINLMLIWWLKPEIGLLFTILAVIHYATVFIYGYFDLDCLDDDNAKFGYAYVGIHLILLAIAIFTNLKWTIITAAITTLAVFLAPDCTGNNIFLTKRTYSKLALLFNTIILAVFVIIDILLPIKFWIKFLLIIGALVIHPIIDYIEGECVIISDVTYDAFGRVINSLKKQKER